MNLREQLLSFARIATAGRTRSILLAGALVLVPTPGRAEYKLQSGDTLEISITGVPDLRQRAPIGVDGDIALPLVGQVQVGRLSLVEATARITQELSNKIYRHASPDGRANPY